MIDANEIKDAGSLKPYDDRIALFLDMTNDEVKEIVMLLFIEEEVKKRLAKYRPQQLASQPI